MTEVIAGRSADEWLALLDEVAVAIKESLKGVTDWRKSGVRPSQYAFDLIADAAALEVLNAANVQVLSEESGLNRESVGAESVGAESAGTESAGVGSGTDSDADSGTESGADSGSSAPIVIVDPVDGSTNASRAIPYFSTSLCVMAANAFQVGLVVDLTMGTRWSAVAGAGAWCDGTRLAAPEGTASDGTAPDGAACLALKDALVVCNGALPTTVRCAQTRTMGSAALDLCGVASGRFDAFVDPTRSLHVWDYAAGVLICQEAGFLTAEVGGKSLTVASSDHLAGPVAAITQQLNTEILGALL